MKAPHLSFMCGKLFLRSRTIMCSAEYLIAGIALCVAVSAKVPVQISHVLPKISGSLGQWVDLFYFCLPYTTANKGNDNFFFKKSKNMVFILYVFMP